MSKLADKRNKAGLRFLAFQFDISQKDYVCYSLFVNDQPALVGQAEVQQQLQPFGQLIDFFPSRSCNICEVF